MQVKRAIVPSLALTEGKTSPPSVYNQKLKMEGKLPSMSEKCVLFDHGQDSRLYEVTVPAGPSLLPQPRERLSPGCSREKRGLRTNVKDVTNHFA